jgi:ribosomal protein S10
LQDNLWKNKILELNLRAYDNKILDASTEEIVNTVKELVQQLKDQYLYQLELKDIQF